MTAHSNDEDNFVSYLKHRYANDAHASASAVPHSPRPRPRPHPRMHPLPRTPPRCMPPHEGPVAVLELVLGRVHGLEEVALLAAAAKSTE